MTRKTNTMLIALLGTILMGLATWVVITLVEIQVIVMMLQQELMDLDKGYSKERMLEIYKDRVDYLIRRGSTLNNPHVPGSYFKDWSTKIVSDHAKKLIKLVDIALKT